MATKIQLQKRANPGVLTIPVELIKPTIDADDRDGLFAFFEGVREQDGVIHDKAWLQMIVNWTPEGGLPLTEVAKWIKLAGRVTDLDEEKEGQFTLSDYQVDLIWKRITDPDFKLVRVQPQFLAFLADLQAAAGRHFPDEEPETEA